MGLFDNLKKRAEVGNKLNEYDERWNSLSAIYTDNLIPNDNYVTTEGNGVSVVSNNIYKEINGELYRMGVSRATYIPNQPTQYDNFIVSENGFAVCYSMSAQGNFEDSRGMGSFQIDYVVHDGSKRIPCKAIVKVGTNDLLKLNDIKPMIEVEPAISGVNLSLCKIDIDDLRIILEQFCKVNNITPQTVKDDRETLLDGVPSL